VLRNDKDKGSTGCEPTEPLLKINAIAHVDLDKIIVSQSPKKGKGSQHEMYVLRWENKEVW
jgi:hypothetical protein